ncbi:phosphoribosylformylglycinamidine synthase subunit PurQ [Symbiobacterium thermophilum]|uniref:Phosphoribosylformylglycinamidine synthase subunit PurQ n=2 Tax=Symbiobacterium thermophilum TaxID=2734 RepID=PURQ_SYMTH|nr:phosphoribosylformylglycinamidine synthase subunit PurQ [Symbiobacterium thermophilum]Q67KF7.1 RecName: Full=Phosphoribosylformylglycinamidine synthase subunit PurQ; Short=FGAM synthase; AltName: Full=Formylglycinamide ribonucleotide amidotransferase subunit I; Short=FGAR amidotransferase I; Short=FGAR-AT I; AltName: Full=Glutaminase PurQ; AltName: Full=Phosphoribosylformylglycinamidine synthase subunit I [Symbiobacterium thermophilum IAM 14863]MBY6274812.1 phosphoribosylformylglycinamidine sy
MRFGILVFPGTNCEMETFYVLREVVGVQADYVWHEARDLTPYDAVVIPGGFTYGDRVRSGALACRAPVMEAVAEFAARGGLVLGICNGFQILTEAGLLPGGFRPNAHGRYRCGWSRVRVENAATPFTLACRPGQVLKIPVSHGMGNYQADPDTLRALSENQQVLFRYCTPEGAVTPGANPNGSAENIAGIVNRTGNVAGVMPHPERATEQVLGSADGRLLFASMVQHLTGRVIRV